MSVQIVQITLGAGPTPIIVPQAVVQGPWQWQTLIIQNNGNNICRVGDQTVTTQFGLVINPGNPPLVLILGLEYSGNLKEWFLAGVTGDVIDILVLA